MNVPAAVTSRLCPVNEGLEAFRQAAETRSPTPLVRALAGTAGSLVGSAADGLDVLSSIRARHDLRAVPIVFLAGCENDEFRWQALRAGADWFGLRPLGMIELQKRVAALIRNGRPLLKAIAGRNRRRPSPRRRLRPAG